jgi:hypothetical protein
MTSHRNFILPPLLAILFLGQAWGQTACDLDNNGTTNVVDVSRAVNMALGTLPCTASVEGAQVCSVITVQRVVNAALGQPCVTYNGTTKSYNVTLSWVASSSASATGYNVYRRTSPTGTATKLNATPIATTTFTDTQVQLGQTYYYTATAVDSAGTESGPSNQVTAVIPTS